MKSNRLGRSSGLRVRSNWLSAAMILTLLSLTLGAMPAAGQTRGPELAFTPSTNGVYDYGTVSQTASQTFTLTNSGGSASGALTVGLTGSAAFTKTADACTGTSLGPGKPCTVTVAFSPATAGSYTATLTATGRKTGVTTSLVLTGTGVRHIYWSNGNGISRADVDGQNVNQFITTAATPSGLAVDSHHIYWSHFSGTIGRADLDGQNVNQSFITGANDPRGVAVDSQHIYWSNLGSGTIGRADLDGQNVNQSFITGASNPFGVAVDSGHIYWTNLGSGTIGRADLDGQNMNQSFITLGSGAKGLAVDSGHIYWSVQTSETIGRADLDGQNVNESFIFFVGQSNGVAVDSGHLYWTSIFYPGIGAIGRADLDGQNVNSNFITDENNPVGIAVDPN